MYLIDTPDSIGGLYVEGIPPSQPATIVPAEHMNAIMLEIANAVESKGLVLDKLDNTQLAQAISGGGHFRNHALNGLMRVAQRHGRGNPKTITFNDGATLVLDRWICDPGVDQGICIVTQRDLDLFAHSGLDQPGLPLAEGKVAQYQIYQQTQTSGATREPRLSQRIPDVRTLAGETVSLSFFGRLHMPVEAGFDQFQMELIQNFGTGGSPSAEVLYTSPTFEIDQSFTVWDRYIFTTTLAKIGGKTFGTDDNSYLEIRFKLSDGGDLFTLYMTGIQLEAASIPGTLEVTPLPLEIDQCQRFYEQSYPYGITAGTITGDGAVHGHEPGADAFALATRFRNTKVLIPTVKWYSPVTGTVAKLAWGASDYSIGAVTDTSTVGTGYPGSTSHNSSNEHNHAHWTAEAEI